jgi:enoyl-CoA hydratase
LKGIDPVDVRRSYRFEQGFTYELTVAGVADEARQAFVDKRDAEFDA